MMPPDSFPCRKWFTSLLFLHLPPHSVKAESCSSARVPAAAQTVYAHTRQLYLHWFLMRAPAVSGTCEASRSPETFGRERPQPDLCTNGSLRTLQFAGQLIYPACTNPFPSRCRPTSLLVGLVTRCHFHHSCTIRKFVVCMRVAFDVNVFFDTLRFNDCVQFFSEHRSKCTFGNLSGYRISARTPTSLLVGAVSARPITTASSCGCRDHRSV